MSYEKLQKKQERLVTEIVRDIDGYIAGKVNIARFQLESDIEDLEYSTLSTAYQQNQTKKDLSNSVDALAQGLEDLTATVSFLRTENELLKNKLEMLKSELQSDIETNVATPDDINKLRNSVMAQIRLASSDLEDADASLKTELLGYNQQLLMRLANIENDYQDEDEATNSMLYSINSLDMTQSQAMSGNIHFVLDAYEVEMDAYVLNSASAGGVTSAFTVQLGYKLGDGYASHLWASVVPLISSEISANDGGILVPTVTCTTYPETNPPQFTRGLLCLTVTFDTDTGNKTYVPGDQILVTIGVKDNKLLGVDLADTTVTFNVV